MKFLYFVAFLQWGILAPLNLVKVLMNKVSPTAHLWVPKESETCQGQCGIARTWATLFWSCQIVMSLGYLYVHYHPQKKTPFVQVGIAQKCFVGLLLMKANYDGVVLKPIGFAGILDLCMAALLAYDVLQCDSSEDKKNGKVNKKVKSEGLISGTLLQLKAFSSLWWFPVVVGCLSGLNTFTLVLSGPLALLFVSTCIARPDRRFLTALTNAIGTCLGISVLVCLIELKGTNWVEDFFPSVFASGSWKRTSELTQNYGLAGVVAVSAMPIVLHPLVLFAMVAKIPSTHLVAAIMVGRTIKYGIMAECAVAAPQLLRFFGVNLEALARQEPGTKKMK